MKKKLVCLFLIMLLVVPFNVFAKKVDLDDYKTMNLKETLKDAGVEQTFKSYSENSKQIPVYLFRGSTCGYCHQFLEFLNSITDEYGKYFKLVSFEVWGDKDNATLMTEVSKFMDKDAGGVPFIIIGDQTFVGYSSVYDDAIKNAIKDLYNTKKSERYDVFEEMNKSEKDSSSSVSSKGVIIWNLIFTVIATSSIIVFINYKFKKLNESITTANKATKISKK